MVSWIPVSNASFSLVPTPSVPATRYESPVCKNFNQHNNKTHTRTKTKVLASLYPPSSQCVGLAYKEKKKLNYSSQHENNL
jgi:hypothetical protein